MDDLLKLINSSGWECFGLFVVMALIIVCITIYNLLERYWEHEEKIRGVYVEKPAPESTEDEDE